MNECIRENHRQEAAKAIDKREVTTKKDIHPNQQKHRTPAYREGPCSVKARVWDLGAAFCIDRSLVARLLESEAHKLEGARQMVLRLAGGSLYRGGSLATVVPRMVPCV